MNSALWLPYLRFLLRAKGRHGLHSPFAYGFVENVLRAGPVRRSLSTPSSASTPPTSTPPVFGARDFQHLVRIIAYWKPGEIRLFPEVITASHALAHLFPSIPVYKADEGTPTATPALWVGKVGSAEGHKLSVFEKLIFKEQPDYKEQAIVLFDASSSPSNRQEAEDLQRKSTLPMGIDFWNGIFLASDSRFRVRQRFQLKGFF